MLSDHTIAKFSIFRLQPNFFAASHNFCLWNLTITKASYNGLLITTTHVWLSFRTSVLWYYVTMYLYINKFEAKAKYNCSCRSNLNILFVPRIIFQTWWIINKCNSFSTIFLITINFIPACYYNIIIQNSRSQLLVFWKERGTVSKYTIMI